MDFTKGILIASSNKAKIKEIKNIFEPLKSIKIYSLKDLDLKEVDVIEDGRTFKENAYKKATSYANKYNILSLADDSGLEVNYLGGAPGVLSARYAGNNASQDDLINKLLINLEGVVKTQRSACFKCVLCLFDPNSNETIYSEGLCNGIITFVKKGINGFGYDPIFLIPELNKTFAELSDTEKNQISHRYKAVDALRVALEECFL